MANPIKVDIIKNTWVLVAGGLTTGQMTNDKTTTTYLATYRIAGDPAPVDFSDSKAIFEKSNAVGISNTDAIDVYIYCKDIDGRILLNV